MVTHRALTPTEAWSWRVRRVGGLIQVGFAGFWLVSGGLAIGGLPGPILAGLAGWVALGVFVLGAMSTAGRAPRPSGEVAETIEQEVTMATLIQLAAVFAAPVVVGAMGHADWTIPAIVVTTGLLLLWLDRRLAIPRYRRAGAALLFGPVALAAVLSGPALVAITGLGAGFLLLATAAAGFGEVAERPSPVAAV